SAQASRQTSESGFARPRSAARAAVVTADRTPTARSIILPPTLARRDFPLIARFISSRLIVVIACFWWAGVLLYHIGRPPHPLAPYPFIDWDQTRLVVEAAPLMMLPFIIF